MKLEHVFGRFHNTLGLLSTLAETRMNRGFQPAQGVSTLGEHLRVDEHLRGGEHVRTKVLIEHLSETLMDRGLALRCSFCQGVEHQRQDEESRDPPTLAAIRFGRVSNRARHARMETEKDLLPCVEPMHACTRQASRVSNTPTPIDVRPGALASLFPLFILLQALGDLVLGAPPYKRPNYSLLIVNERSETLMTQGETHPLHAQIPSSVPSNRGPAP